MTDTSGPTSAAVDSLRPVDGFGTVVAATRAFAASRPDGRT